LNAFFDRILDVERIKIGKRQTIDTLISEEALLFAKYIRNERMATKNRYNIKHLLTTKTLKPKQYI